MSFHEKSAWACLIAISVAYVPYFALALRFPMAAIGLFWISAIGVVVLLTVFHIVNAIVTRSIRATGDVPPADELDRKIELEAAKWAAFVLAFAVVAWIVVAMYSIPVIGSIMFEQTQAARSDMLSSSHAIPMLTAMSAVHWLFASFVFANVAYYGGIVFRYRRLTGA